MKILFNEQQIKDAINKIATEIWNKHYNDPNPPVMICVLNGAFMFFSDLVKEIKLDCEIDFMRVKSYVAKESSHVSILKTVELPIQGKDIYIIDDILDSGKTLLKIEKHLSTFHPKSTTLVSLFKKHTCQIESISGIILHDEKWLCGYGLDATNGLMRNRTVVFGEVEEIE